MARNISGTSCGNMDKTHYKTEFERLLKIRTEGKFFIKESNATFKISKFTKKGTDSLALAHFINSSTQDAKDYWTITISYYAMLYLAKAAILTKGYETDDHYSTQIALGYLLVPSQIEREDLELLEQTHKIFEDAYVEYFQDARQESHTSRYSATKHYNDRRVKEVLENARKFIEKLSILLT